MHGVVLVGVGGHFALLDDVPEPLILGNFPLHPGGLAQAGSRHGIGIRGYAGPQNDRIRNRIARGNAVEEGALAQLGLYHVLLHARGEAALGIGRVGGGGGQSDGGAGGAGGLQEAAAIDVSAGRSGLILRITRHDLKLRHVCRLCKRS